METWEEKKERLRNWINTLSEDQKNETLLTCIEELIEKCDINFWEDSEKPYWNNSGEYIDKTN